MPLPRFTLADLTAEQLTAEMLRRLPAHTPEWADPQPGDPGRTLVELFAWLAETLLYRVNLIPERQRLEFLRLLNIGLRPAQPARGLVTLAPADPAAAAPRAVPVPLGTPVEGAAPFETTGDITVQPFEGRVFIKRRPSEAERAATAGLLQDLQILYGVGAGDPYVTTPLFADGRFDPRGLDPLTLSVDRAVWIALLAPAAETRDAALGALDAQPALLNIGVVPRLVLPDPDAPPPDLPDLWLWEATTVPRRPGEPLGFTTLEVEQDGTGGLARTGTLRLLLPPRAAVFGPSDDVRADFRAGVGPRPPRLDDPDLQARLLFWLRLRPAGGGDALPLAWLGVNAVTADGRRTLRDLVVGTGEGLAGQEVALPGRSVDPASLAIEVEESGRGFVRWAEIPDLGALGPDGRGFELDPEAGLLRFGDGVRGRAPEPGARIAARLLRHGGGAAGNLPAGAVTGIALAGLTAANPAPMTGGAEAETVAQALRRIPAVLRHGGRCVTERDYADLARATPGAEIARVEVLPRFRPFQRRFGVPGTVSVMVLPRADVPKPPNPRPGRVLIEQVTAELAPRRPLATELFVIGPEYRGLALAAAFGVREGAARDQVARAVREALALYLWPLPPGGRDGEGWPLGAAVSNLELEVAMARVPGVQRTGGVLLFAPGTQGFTPLPRETGSGAQALPLDAWQLPELLAIELAVGADRPPETLAAPPPLGGTGAGEEGPVPVPVVPEVCR